MAISECGTGVIDAPKEKKKQLLSFETRREFGSAGASLQLSYDIESDDFGADLPITFIRDKEKNLTGGIRFGWMNSNHELAVGLFVGSKFKAF